MTHNPTGQDATPCPLCLGNAPDDLAANTASHGVEEAQRTCRPIGDQLGLPCRDPVRNGVARIVDELQQCFRQLTLAQAVPLGDTA
ncbi:MAG: hypothetical protein QM599_06750 [Pseudoxanthomonas sp.]